MNLDIGQTRFCTKYVVFDLALEMDYTNIEANFLLLKIIRIRQLFLKYPIQCKSVICIEILKKTLKFCSPEINIELLKHSSFINPSELFLIAAKHGRLCTMIYLRDNTSIDLHIKDENNNSILHILASQGYVHTCVSFIHWIQSEQLSEKGKIAAVNQPNQQGFTPLHYAALSNSENMCKFLLYLGADRTKKENLGLTPYELGKSQGISLNVLKTLKPSWRSYYRNNSSKKYILNLGFQLTRYFIIFAFLIPHINFIFAGISLTFSTFVLFMIVYISNNNPGFASPLKEDLQDLVMKNGPDTCTRCKTVQFQRSVIKHCWDCQKCVEKYDHHCPWLRNCIGKNNSNFFIWYLILFMLEMVFHSIVCLTIIIWDFGSGEMVSLYIFKGTEWDRYILIGLVLMMLPCEVAVIYILKEQIERLNKGKTSFELKFLKGSPLIRPRSVYEDFRQNSVVSLSLTNGYNSRKVNQVYS